MTCGIYEIWCGPYFYQGSSKNIESRWKRHQSDLHRGKHVNPAMQGAFNKYGWADAIVLAECDERVLLAWEQAYIDTNWGDGKCLNLNPVANTPPSNKGKPHTPETRAKMRASALGVTPNDETRAKLRAAKLGKPCSKRDDASRARSSAATSAYYARKRACTPNLIFDLFGEDNL
jgi:group I intron endonuclease